jgi:hypothetical protein
MGIASRRQPRHHPDERAANGRCSSPAGPKISTKSWQSAKHRRIPDILIEKIEQGRLRRRTVVTKFAVVIAGGLVLAAAGSWVAAAQTVRTEEANHPRIAVAIRDLEDAIRYMEAAPHDFGGHKAAAIRDSRAAVVQLKLALAYRAVKDR